MTVGSFPEGPTHRRCNLWPPMSTSTPEGGPEGAVWATVRSAQAPSTIMRIPRMNGFNIVMIALTPSTEVRFVRQRRCRASRCGLTDWRSPAAVQRSVHGRRVQRLLDRTVRVSQPTPDQEAPLGRVEAELTGPHQASAR